MSRIEIRNANIFTYGSKLSKDGFVRQSIFIKDKRQLDTPQNSILSILDFGNYFIIPGLVDVHTHLREPGFLYKEGIKSGSLAAARGGFTTVFAMPNLNPVPDSLENLNVQRRIIEQEAVIEVLPYGAITKCEKGLELADMKAMSKYVVAFSDDGKGVQSTEMCRIAMKTAKELGKIIVAHCEDESLLKGGYIHDGEYSKAHGHKGICSESEYAAIARDLELVSQTGVAYHVCHVSAKQSVELIRQAKKDGLNVSAETAPHYLILDDSMLKEEGRFKMNPPIRAVADRQALIEGILDGTIDMIATDHAPHSKEEKSAGLKNSLFGVVGLEIAFPLMYTHFVRKGIISFEKLMELMCYNPRARFNLPVNDILQENGDFAVFDLNKRYIIEPNKFLSKGRATPFECTEVFGDCIMTIKGGQIAWQNSMIKS